MPKIQIDIPDALLESLRQSFEMKSGSTIPIANRHLVQWCIEQYVHSHPQVLTEHAGDTSKASEDTPSLEDVFSELDERAAEELEQRGASGE